MYLGEAGALVKDKDNCSAHYVGGLGVAPNESVLDFNLYGGSV